MTIVRARRESDCSKERGLFQNDIPTRGVEGDYLRGGY